MASPGELVGLISSVLGAPQASVYVAHKLLREAGLITKGGRGTSAARMTSSDAAALLIGVVGTSSVKDSLLPVRRHGRMLSIEGSWRLAFLPIPEMLALPSDHNLSDAVEALVDAMSGGSLGRIASEASGETVDLVHDIRSPVEIEVTIFEPLAWSSIELSMVRYDNEARRIVEEHEIRNYSRSRRTGVGNLSFDPPLDLTVHGDLTHRHTFTQKTIGAVGNLLRG